MKLSEFNKQYKLENPLYNMIERTGAPMFVVFVFFLTGIPVSIILNEKTGTSVAFIFAMLYPMLGGVFFQANIVLQACLIPVFFAFRSWYEYKADAAITNKFGSDKLPFFNFLGVMLHEICLSVMITSIKHPLVFVT